MVKEFEINDILSAVNSIFKVQRKKDKIIKAKNDDFVHNNQVESKNSEILVLDQMIE